MSRSRAGKCQAGSEATVSSMWRTFTLRRAVRESVARCQRRAGGRFERPYHLSQLVVPWVEGAGWLPIAFPADTQVGPVAGEAASPTAAFAR